MSTSERGDRGTDDTLAPVEVAATIAPPAVEVAAPPAVADVAATIAPPAVDTGGATIAAPPAASARTQPEVLAFALPPLASDLYELHQEIGRGGMGRVVAARDRRLDRPVALKLLQVQDAAIAERFRREARITARLQHPGIVPLYEAGRMASGEPFYAMKHVAGRPLDHVIAQAETTRARLEILPSILAVADALAYAHDRRIIHRDLKPGNVILGEFGETVVIDWGLAKDLDDTAPAIDAGPYRAPAGGDGSLTMAGAVMGTPAYMPPEQARGDAVDERADVYAIGAIMYQALTGELVHPGTTIDAILVHAIEGAPVRPIAELAPDIPTDLAAIAMKALAPEPADRYASAKDLAADLRRFQAGQLVGVHRYTARALAWRWVKRHRGAVIVAAAAVIVVATLSVLGLSRIASERAEAVHQRGEAEVAARRAQAAAHDAETASDDAILAQAASLAATDPAAAIAWLKRLSPATTRSTAARTIAADAAHHHIPDLLPAPNFLVEQLRGNPAGTALFAYSTKFSKLVVYDLATSRSRQLDLTDSWPSGPTSADGRLMTARIAAGVTLIPVDGGPLRTLPDTLDATPVAFSFDGAWLAIRDEHGSRIMPLAGGPARPLVPPLSDAEIAFTPDGSSVVEVSANSKVIHVHALADLAAAPRELAIETATAVVSEDGAHAAYLADDGSLVLVAIATGARTPVAGITDITELVPRGGSLAMSAGNRWQILQPWDGGAAIRREADFLAAAGGAVAWVAHDQLSIEGAGGGALPWRIALPGGASALWLSPDGKDAVVAAGDGTLRRWRLARSLEQPVCGNAAQLPTTEASPDGRWLVQPHGTLGALQICDPRTDTSRTATLATEDAPAIGHLVWSGDGQTLVTSANKGAGGFAVWNLPTGTGTLVANPGDQEARAIAIGNGAARLVIARPTPEVDAIDVATGAQTVLCTGIAIRRVSADLKQGFGGTADAMGGCDLATGRTWTTGPLVGDQFDAAIAPDGSTAVVTTDHGATMWNLATHTRAALDLGTVEWPRQIGYARDGSLVMIATPTFATIFDRAGKVSRRLRLPPGYLQQIWFSPDGTRVVVADQTNGATIYDLATGQRRSVKTPEESTIGAAFLAGEPGAVLSIGGVGSLTITRWADDLPTDAAGVRAWIAASTSAVLDADGRLAAAAATPAATR